MAKKEPGRYAVRVTNHVTGERWAIHDTKAVCDKELARRLADWGAEACVVDGPVPIEES